MEKITALIVDDEPVAREGIRVLLAENPEIDVVGEAADGRQAVEAIQDLAPDLVFLDVQMPESDGFAVIEAIGADRMPVVIFVTAYDSYALKAFDVAAIDYLLKPYDDERFRAAVNRAVNHIRKGELEGLSRKLIALLEERAQVPAIRSGRYLERVMIKTGGRVIFLKVDEIDWIEAEGDYVRLHVGTRWHLLRDTMKRLEAQLDPSKFVRTHRSTIVNLERIKELHPYFHGDYAIILHDGTELKLSRSRRHALEDRLGRPL